MAASTYAKISETVLILVFIDIVNGVKGGLRKSVRGSRRYHGFPVPRAQKEYDLRGRCQGVQSWIRDIAITAECFYSNQQAAHV
jgi:hypothetical protein